MDGLSWKIPWKRMMTGGTPILGNLDDWGFPFRHRATPSHHPFRTMGFYLPKTIQLCGGTIMTMETAIYGNPHDYDK